MRSFGVGTWVTVTWQPQEGQKGGTVPIRFGLPGYTACKVVTQGRELRLWRRFEYRLRAYGPLLEVVHRPRKFGVTKP